VTRIRAALLVASLLAGLPFVHASQGADEPVTLRIIVVGTADEAQRVLARLRSGADFAALARAESIDPTSSAGGLLGSVSPSTLRPELRDALRRVSAGQVTEAVPIPTGFALLKVEPSSAAAATANAGAPPAVAAAGAVKYTLDVGGLGEAEAVLREFEKPAGWNQDPQAICDARRKSMAEAQQAFEDFFKPEFASVRLARPPFEIMQA